MKIVVLDANTLGEDIDLSPISKLGETTIYLSSTKDEIQKRTVDANIIVTNKCRLNAETLKNATNLKLICVAATGYDNIDTVWCKEKGIAVCNVKGYSTDNVAQVAISMALSLVNHMNEYTSFVNTGKYSSSGAANRLSPIYHEISSLTWGVIGLGNIGRKVAQVAKALGCNVIANRRKSSDDEFKCVSLEELVKSANIITIHTPLTPETKKLINEDNIKLMKDKVIIVNVARGAVCDEEAIVKYITNGKIGGFGCDVYSEEPFSKSHVFNKILNNENVILTPHMAWGSKEARFRCINEIANNIVAFINGENKSRIV